MNACEQFFVYTFCVETHGRLGKQASDIQLRKLSRDRDAGNHHDRHELFGTRERNVKLLRWGTLLSVSLQCAATLKSWPTPIIIG
jgi:hypothetical protein